LIANSQLANGRLSMATILLDGLAIEAVQLICDPPPEERPGSTILLRVTSINALPKHVEGAVPIVFPFGESFYRGDFELASRAELPDGSCYTFVSNDEVEKCIEPERSGRLARFIGWRKLRPT
jgi:hypothetical protein